MNWQVTDSGLSLEATHECGRFVAFRQPNGSYDLYLYPAGFDNSPASKIRLGNGSREEIEAKAAKRVQSWRDGQAQLERIRARKNK